MSVLWWNSDCVQFLIQSLLHYNKLYEGWLFEDTVSANYWLFADIFDIE